MITRSFFLKVNYLDKLRQSKMVSVFFQMASTIVTFELMFLQFGPLIKTNINETTYCAV